MTLIKTGLNAYINAAYEQATKFNHNTQRTQQAIKQAILLGLVEEHTQKIFVRYLSATAAVFSYEKIDDTFREGRLLGDPYNHNIIISDGINCYTFLTKETKQTGNLLVALGRTRRETSLDSHDGRFSISVYLKDYAIGQSSNYIMFNAYLIQNLLWNEDARDILRAALLSDKEDSTELIVNHKNNDSRDISYDNLEFVTQALNIMHGQFVKMISLSNNYKYLCGTPYYVAKSKTNDNGKWITPLKIKLSAYDISEAFDESMATLLRKYNIQVEE